MIQFNQTALIGRELDYIKQALTTGHLSGDGSFTKKCHEWLETETHCLKALLTTSCTHALEMAALLTNIQQGDEVIMPSYTFVSTANAFVLRGARIVFVDIRPDTMNIDEQKIEAAITRKTKAIVPVHYAGVACEMDTIMSIAERYHLIVVEDAAQGIMASYKGKALGAIGDLGTYSFHETKNVVSGEGGALLINQVDYVERAEIIREKGTNRSQFFRGQVDKYTWQDVGSSYLPSELLAAVLMAQLESAAIATEKRISLWTEYYNLLTPFAYQEIIDLPIVPNDCEHNGHLFYLKLKNNEQRQNLIEFFKKHGVTPAFHYIPLHSSPAGRKYSVFHGEDLFTTTESERLLRLPLHFTLQLNDVHFIVSLIEKFFKTN